MLIQPFSQRIRARAGTLAVIVVLGTGCSARSDDARIEVQAHHLAGDELRLVVETYRQWRPLFAHSSKVADVKGYYVAINLAAPGPLAERTRVVGPLWTVPNTRSALSFEAGPHFTPEDAAASAATPRWTIDSTGTLVRMVRDPQRPLLLRQALVVAPDAASWRLLGEARPVVDSLSPFSEDRVVTRAGRHLLLRQDGKVRLFDLFTGEEQADPWLTQSFADVRSIPTLGNIRSYLTDDLKFLVVCPEELWHERGVDHKTFDYHGQTYQRGAVGLAYQRDRAEPTLFKRPLDDAGGFRGREPHAAFSIRGDLFLFTGSDRHLTLAALDGGRKYEVEAPPGKDWELYPFRDAQLDPTRDQLILCGVNEDASIALTRWDYAQGQIRCDNVPVRPAFEPRGNQLQPVSALPVR